MNPNEFLGGKDFKVISQEDFLGGGGFKVIGSESKRTSTSEPATQYESKRSGLSGVVQGGADIVNKPGEKTVGLENIPILGSFIRTATNLGKAFTTGQAAQEQEKNYGAITEIAKSADNIIAQAQKEQDPVKKKYLLELANRTIRHTEDFGKLNEELKKFQTSYSQIAGDAGQAALTAATMAPTGALAQATTGVRGAIQAGLDATAGGGLLARTAVGAGVGAGLQATSNLSEGKNIGDNVGTSALIGGSIPLVSGLVSKALPKIASKLEEWSLNMTPSAKNKLGKDLQEVIDFGTKQKLIGSSGSRLEQANTLYEKTEDQLSNFLKNAKGGAKKSDILSELDALKESLVGQRDAVALARQVDEAKKSFELIKADNKGLIPWDKLNEFKRSTFSNAFNQAGDKVSDWLELKIGNIAYNKLKTGLDKLSINGKSLKEFNRQYQLLIKYKALLKASANKPEISNTSARLIGAAFGLDGFGSPLLGAVAGPTILGNAPVTATRSLIGASAQNSGEFLNKASKTGLGRRIFGK